MCVCVCVDIWHIYIYTPHTHTHTHTHHTHTPHIYIYIFIYICVCVCVCVCVWCVCVVCVCVYVCVFYTQLSKSIVTSAWLPVLSVWREWTGVVLNGNRFWEGPRSSVAPFSGFRAVCIAAVPLHRLLHHALLYPVNAHCSNNTPPTSTDKQHHTQALALSLLRLIGDRALSLSL